MTPRNVEGSSAAASVGRDAGPNTHALLRVDGAVKRFGSLIAIDTVSFALGHGEALGVIGPNGAGKTTLFNLIAGDARPNKGRVFLDRVDVTDWSAHDRARKGIGRTYQIPHPFVGMTVFENILVGACYGTGRSETKCYDDCATILDRTRLADKANRLAGSLTLLERKRLELARALATSPRVLLLDEIAGGLTDAECHDLIETIEAIRAGNTSIIWIEHIVHALLSVVDRLIVLNFGRLIDDGEPKTVFESSRVQEIYMGISAE